MNYKTLIFTLTIVVFSIFSIQGSVHMEGVDWIRGKIVSTGISSVYFNDNGMPSDRNSQIRTSVNRGRMNAFYEAKALAKEKLVNKLKMIQVNADKKLFELVNESKYTKSKINRIIEDEIVFKNIPGNFGKTLCIAELNIAKLCCALPFFYPDKNFPSEVKSSIKTEYTSLIIDARNIGVKPMILPSIYDEKGLEIYGRKFINIRYASKYRMVSYAYNETEAKNNIKAGKFPFYTIALKSLKGCPVISREDIIKIFSHEKTVRNLKICKVIFIIDRQKQ